MTLPPIERHPFPPFLPPHARLLMLGSFPPQEKRWAMPFYYPNLQNDMWRIFGYIYKKDKNAFVDLLHKGYYEKELVLFLQTLGVALYDTACAVRRLAGNAADKDLEVVEATDIEALLNQIPLCTNIVTTGQKATETLCDYFDILPPRELGSYTSFTAMGRDMRLYRMPSSSRAYPLALEKKATYYQKMLQEIGLL